MTRTIPELRALADKFGGYGHLVAHEMVDEIERLRLDHSNPLRLQQDVERPVRNPRKIRSIEMTDERFSPARLYDRYRVKIAICDRICGGMPKNPDLIKTWVESTTGHADEITEKLIQENAELVVNAVAEKCWNGFPEDPKHGLFIPCRNIKACLKQSAQLLGIYKKQRGSKQIMAEGMEVKANEFNGRTDRVYLGKKAPDGTDESAIHVMTAQGPRTALRRMDYVTQPEISFEIWVLKTATQETRHIGEEQLVEILTHAQENGLGASRSQGEGKFEVVEFQKI
jgi:hypothetical protein